MRHSLLTIQVDIWHCWPWLIANTDRHETENIMKQPYTCTDYRQEMILVGLKQQLANPDLDPAERKRLEDEVRKLEAAMGMD